MHQTTAIPLRPGVNVQPVLNSVTLAARLSWPMITFVILVLLPSVATGWYLLARAGDQFVSQMNIAIRAEEQVPSLGPLSALNAFVGAGLRESDILASYLGSPAFFAALDDATDLRAAWANSSDPAMSLSAKASAEDLAAFARRMIRVRLDAHSGLLSVEVSAFDPDSAFDIAGTVLDLSNRMIDDLTSAARRDATRQADVDLSVAVADLQSVRSQMAAFRIAHRTADPARELEGSADVISHLRQTLAENLIELDLLRASVSPSRTDTRAEQAQRRVDILSARIEEERRKFDDSDGQGFATLLSDYERLSLDLELAERSYASALAAREAARGAADRQARHLLVYAPPTRPQSAIYPRRMLILCCVAGFGMLAWAALTLFRAALRSRV